jgi:hypothetical protein
VYKGKLKKSPSTILCENQMKILYLSCFTVNSCNIPVVLWQPTVDISAKWSNKLHLWRVVIIKWIIGNPLLELCHVIRTLWTPAPQQSLQWAYFTLRVSLSGYTDHSPLSSYKVKNGGAIPQLPNTSSWHTTSLHDLFLLIIYPTQLHMLLNIFFKKSVDLIFLFIYWIN